MRASTYRISYFTVNFSKAAAQGGTVTAPRKDTTAITNVTGLQGKLKHRKIETTTMVAASKGRRNAMSLSNVTLIATLFASYISGRFLSDLLN